MRTRILTFLLIALLLLMFVVTVHSLAQVPPAAAVNQAELRHPGATVTELEAQGDQLRVLKNYDQAIACYRAALAQQPRSAVLYNKAGISEILKNDLKAAKRDVELALKYDPQYSDARNNLGVIYYMQRDYKKAIKNYEKAIKLRESSASFHSNLGTAFFARKEFDRAVVEYTRAVELDPDVLIRSSTGGVAAHLASPQDRARYSFTLARIYAQRGDVDRCLQCLQRAKENGYPKLQDVYADAAFTAVRADPRFNQLQIPVPGIQ